MFLYLGGVWMPHVCTPPYVCTPLYIHMPPGVYSLPYAPILFCACVFLEALNAVGVVMGSPLCWNTSLIPPLFGGASPSITPLHSVIGSLCISMFEGYQYVIWAFPFCWRVWGCSPISWGLGASALEMSICSFLYLFCSVLCLMFQLWLQYYSFSYSGVFWPVISVISDSGSFPDRVCSKHDSTTTLDAKRLWRCSWLSFCATAATSIFNASFRLCQLCYGFSSGRFHFQRWASHHFVSCICLVSILVSAFYF